MRVREICKTNAEFCSKEYLKSLKIFKIGADNRMKKKDLTEVIYVNFDRMSCKQQIYVSYVMLLIEQ